MACQGLDLGCCRGTRRFDHLSGTLSFIYLAPVTLPDDPGHSRVTGVAAGCWGHSTMVGVTGFGFSGHQEFRLLGRAGICQSEGRQNIPQQDSPAAGKPSARSVRGGLARPGEQGGHGEVVGGNSTLEEALLESS